MTSGLSRKASYAIPFASKCGGDAVFYGSFYDFDPII